MKSNLDKRVDKARKLRFTPLKVKGSPEEFNTWGSKDDHYVLSLTSQEVKIYPRLGEERIVTAFFTNCNKHAVNMDNPYIVDIQPCRGNCDHTVCYHAIGKIIHVYRGTGKEIQFLGTYDEANNSACYENGDKPVKIFNGNRRGYIWMVVRYSMDRAISKSEMSLVNLAMRGTKSESEGID